MKARISNIHNGILDRGHRSVALICKTRSRKRNVFLSHSKKRLGMAVQLLGEQSDINEKNCLLIVPSHLAKGLEFDAVIVAAFDEPFRDHPIDRKLLYVAMTRPMHELHLVGLSI